MSNELATKPAAGERAETWLHPRYEVTEGKKSYEIEVSMPGTEKEDAIISLQDKELLIEGKKPNSLPVDARWLHRETNGGGYRLRLQLNIDIDPNGITANSENGILRIHLPIAEAAQPRTIRIN